MNDTDQILNEPETGPGNDENAVTGHGEHKDNGETTREIGGRKGLDPVRYGDWEKKGRCIDF